MGQFQILVIAGWLRDAGCTEEEIEVAMMGVTGYPPVDGKTPVLASAEHMNLGVSSLMMKRFLEISKAILKSSNETTRLTRFVLWMTGIVILVAALQLVIMLCK